jgi:hypothetical protein
MVNRVELFVKDNYGEFVNVDLYENQSITFINSLKDIRDIKKVFTSYSKKFTVPASKTNNKLFQHYDNYEIDGYDGRVRSEAGIKVGGGDYKKGSISIIGATVVNGETESYNLVFYGNTVTLNELIGDDELKVLALEGYLQGFDHLHSAANVVEGLTEGWNLSGGSLSVNTGTDCGDMCYPFISGENFYFYDSDNTGTNPKDGVESRNIKSTATTSPRGISIYDLKPAVRIHHIIKAIEDRYGITFSTDFFNTSNDMYHELYMWMHRERGGILEQIEDQSVTIPLDDWEYVAAESQGDFRVNDDKELQIERLFGIVFREYEYELTVTPTGTGIYSLSLVDALGGEDLPTDDTIEEINGTQTINWRIRPEGGYMTETNIRPVLRFTNKTGVTAVKFELRLKETLRLGTSTNVISYSNYHYNSDAAVTLDATIGLVDLMPKMKVVDFLSGLFKLWNLIAYVDDTTGDVVVKTYDDFYAGGSGIDISKYVEHNKWNVNKANLYRQLSFKFEDPKTFAIVQSNNLTYDNFGDEKLTHRNSNIRNPLAFDGGTYEVKNGFSKMMFERMQDQDDATAAGLTDIQWGWSADEDQRPTVTKPLLMYCKKEAIGEIISVDNDGLGGSYNNIGSGQTGEEDVIRPSNTVIDTSVSPTEWRSLHYGSEIDEYTRGTVNNSLFADYWFNWIVPIYDERSRIVKVTAHLPSYIIQEMDMDDTLIIDGKGFRINKVKINLLTGKADLELINDIDLKLFSTSQPPADAEAPTAPTLTLDATGDVYVDLSWSGATDNVAVTGHKIYKNGFEVRDYAAPTASGRISRLAPSTNYDFTCKAYDAVGNLSPVSNTINVTTTADTTDPDLAETTFVSKTSNSITVNFYGEDNVGVTSFDVYKDNSFVTNVSAINGFHNGYTYSLLSANTFYLLRCTAKDAAGNTFAGPNINIQTDEV